MDPACFFHPCAAHSSSFGSIGLIRTELRANSGANANVNRLRPVAVGLLADLPISLVFPWK